ncbi:C-reactive protein-like [Sceloporus undulatus]|uniref:C-reactive protein-like n=1 Tax=Sceloporus undulatus TaxID=8520 RepID=UPI001C4CE9BF|nr:C-reactive protein-like [Sceloporus undulatus]
MATLYPFLLILASLLGSLGQEDLQKKAFVFPIETNSASVVLKAPLQQQLTSFTICLRYYTLLTREYGLFSYATKTRDNELLLFKPKPNQYRLYLGGASVTFVLPEKKNAKPAWEHICMSWESATGIVELWLDGEPLPRMGLQKGYSISPEASIVLGQDQDSFGGGFAINQSLVGEMKDVYMWDRVLTADEVQLVLQDRSLSNYLINWRSLNYEIKGYVVLKPHLISSRVMYFPSPLPGPFGV